ncbi:hypothetical protein [Rahnella sp. CJA17(1/100)]|uniref:hypothetical protein n=1 Tax=Rahnella sp. CJA17(1/100) TaxID=2508951 RepID=UPI00106F26CE|nr:hypothetical protein [Rahnella sp. CJA17(1/100)]
MDDLKKKILDEFKLAVTESIREKVEDDNLSILNLNVMSKAKKLSVLNSKEIFSALIETVVELEATKIALSAAKLATDASQKLIQQYRESDTAMDEFHDVALSSVYTMGDLIQNLGSELDAAPQRLASAGGKGKSQKYDVLKKRVFELYEAKKWNSPREAAQKIEADIIELSIQSGVPLSGSQPWETIHKWILKHIKK